MSSVYLIGGGIAALAFWWFNRSNPTDPDNVTPERKNRFDQVESCWYTIEGLRDNELFQSEAAKTSLDNLQAIVIERLKRNE